MNSSTKLKLFTKNLKHFKDQISKTVDSINVSKIPKKRKKVNIVLTYQRNGQVKFKDFGLAYTNDPLEKQRHVTTILNQIRKNQKELKELMEIFLQLHVLKLVVLFLVK